MDGVCFFQVGGGFTSRWIIPAASVLSLSARHSPNGDNSIATNATNSQGCRGISTCATVTATLLRQTPQWLLLHSFAAAAPTVRLPSPQFGSRQHILAAIATCTVWPSPLRLGRCRRHLRRSHSTYFKGGCGKSSRQTKLVAGITPTFLILISSDAEIRKKTFLISKMRFHFRQ